jgi:ribose 5-phosphate isomerase A
MPDYENEKRLAAERSLEYIEEGMAVGLGTGSTATYFVRALGERVRSGFSIRALPTSPKTQVLAREVGIPLSDFSELRHLDVTVDGADEVDPNLNLVKGGGGALLREKIIAAITECLVIVGDSRKSVTHLGRFPLPVEVIPFGWEVVAERISELNARAELRRRQDGTPFFTVEQNFILDCSFASIPDPAGLASELRKITGVVEHGLFVDWAKVVIFGKGNKTEVLQK